MKTGNEILYSPCILLLYTPFNPPPTIPSSLFSHCNRWNSLLEFINEVIPLERLTLFYMKWKRKLDLLQRSSLYKIIRVKIVTKPERVKKKTFHVCRMMSYFIKLLCFHIECILFYHYIFVSLKFNKEGRCAIVFKQDWICGHSKQLLDYSCGEPLRCKGCFTWQI